MRYLCIICRSRPVHRPAAQTRATSDAFGPTTARTGGRARGVAVRIFAVLTDDNAPLGHPPPGQLHVLSHRTGRAGWDGAHGPIATTDRGLCHRTRQVQSSATCTGKAFGWDDVQAGAQSTTYHRFLVAAQGGATEQERSNGPTARVRAIPAGPELDPWAH
jgi:hypothetical protein